jgi:DNA-nicking Smr family endonuclease
LPAHWHREGSVPARLPRDPDAAALAMAMSGVAPLPDCNRVVLGTPPPPPRPLQSIEDEHAALHESLHGQIGLQDRLEGGDEPQYLRNGLASSVLRDLRRGRWVIQAELDLHGLNRDEARQQLATFLQYQVMRNLGNFFYREQLRCRQTAGKGNNIRLSS